MVYVRILSDFLFFFFALFAVSSTFSIALAQISLGISLLLYLIIIIIKKENPFAGNLKLFYLSIGLYIIWMVVASLLGNTPRESLFILKEEWLFFAIPIGIYLMQKESFVHKIFLSFAIAIGIISLYGITQHFTGIYWFKKTHPIEAFDFGYRVKGFFPHRLTFGNYFAVASMFLLGYLTTSWKELNFKWKLFLSIDVILSIIVTFYSYSYGPIIAIVGTVIFLGFIRQPKYALYITICVIAVTTIFISINTTFKERVIQRVDKELNIENEASRIYIWDNALAMVKDNPIFGVGQGNFYPQFEKNRPGHRIHVHAHNDFINIGALAGIPGFLFFSSIWILLFKMIFRKWKNNSTPNLNNKYLIAGLLGSIAFFITSLTEATFADEEVRQLLMFVFAFGLFSIVLKDEKERN